MAAGERSREHRS